MRARSKLLEPNPVAALTLEMFVITELLKDPHRSEIVAQALVETFLSEVHKACQVLTVERAENPALADEIKDRE